MEPVILFTSPPNLEEMCGITVLVKPLSQTPFKTVQPHITKCREMIFTDPEVIASPCYDLDASFNIVMLQSYFKTGRVQTRLNKQGLQLSKPYRVLPSLYQSCLHYTMLAKLAPVWNRTGEWFLQGRDFLMHTGYTNAIKMKLCVNTEEMYVSLIGTVIKSPPLQIEDLNLSREKMQEMVKSTEDCSTEVTITDIWCHVLPSMKRGRIISLSLNISRMSPFTSYRDLQRHWKNMYGYRLPDTDEDILYCQIGFLPSGGGTHFTYPNICLRSGPMQVIQRVDPKPILTAFLQDIHSRVGTVCGNLLRFQPKLSFAFPSLHVAGQETGKINLSSKPVNKSIAPKRSQKSMSHLYSGINSDKKMTVREKLCGGQKVETDNKENNPQIQTQQYTRPVNEYIAQVNITSSECTSPDIHTQVQNMHDNKIWTNNARILEKDNVSETIFTTSANTKNVVHDQTNNSLIQSQRAKSDCKENMNMQSTIETKYIPHFKPKLPRLQMETKYSDLESSNCKDSKSQSFIPIFKSQISKYDSVSSHVKKTKTKYSHDVGDIKELLSNVTSAGTSVGSSIQSLSLKQTSLSSSKLSSTDTHRSNTESLSQYSVSVPHFRKQTKPNMSPHGAQTHQSSQLQLSNHPTASKLKPITGTALQTNERGIHKFQVHNPGPCIQIAKNSLNTSFTPVPGDVSVTCKSLMIPKLTNINSQCTDGINMEVKKRKLKQGEDTLKKSRGKPQVQVIDVESLARANQLSKVNAVTLIAWLKDKGVICKSKDKKNDLVEKVNRYIDSSKPLS